MTVCTDWQSQRKMGRTSITNLCKERSHMFYSQKAIMRASVALCGAAIAVVGFLTPASAQQQYDGSLYSGLRWRSIGPFRGGRVNGVTGVRGQPNTFYFGSVGGGVWKSTNAGRTWTPIFDSQPVASIGALAVAPSNPNVIYVGTGETDVRSQISYGNGMYKSTDAGKTWAHIGLDDTRQIGRVIVDPKNPDVVFAAALGHVYGPNPDRGVFRSRDGGKTWQKALFKNENVGAADLALDPQDSQIIYASLWNTRRPPWSIYPPSYGPGGGLYKSADGDADASQIRARFADRQTGRESGTHRHRRPPICRGRRPVRTKAGRCSTACAACSINWRKRSARPAGRRRDQPRRHSHF